MSKVNAVRRGLELHGRSYVSQFVPSHAPLLEKDLARLEQFVRGSKRLFVLSGAGVSTESGIKDYRSEGVGLYATSSQRPTNMADFVRSAHVRQRYWARNTAGWSRFRAFTPNSTHEFLAALEREKRLHWLVTQNVDRLHQKAGSQRVTELHGSVYTVSCLACGYRVDRDSLQERILQENPAWSAVPEGFAPDADAYISEEAVQSFRTPLCQLCGGDLKPDVVFFGDSVPRARVKLINDHLETADGCIVVGTSLETYSSLRHVQYAKDLGLPLLILNIGRTRADGLADVKISGRCGQAFQWLGRKLFLD